MTNVPGFIPKPYPIVIFPGTFVIILPKVAVVFFPIIKKSFDEKNCRKKWFNVEKWNVGNNLKRVLPKFEAERSYPRGVNGRSKIRLFWHPKTLNGRKIARIARISTIFGPNRSQRRELKFENLSNERMNKWRNETNEKCSENFPKEIRNNFRTTTGIK